MRPALDGARRTDEGRQGAPSSARPRAVELLKDLYREDGNDFVFIGSQAGSGLSNMAMTTVLRRMGRGDITVHGFEAASAIGRRSAPTSHARWPSMALAHTIGDKVEAAYRRGDLFAKRAQLMAAWAKYCEAPCRPVTRSCRCGARS